MVRNQRLQNPALEYARRLPGISSREEDTAGSGIEGAPTPAATYVCGTWKPRWSPGLPGKPTARKAQLSSGNRMAQEANAGGSKGQRKILESFNPGHNSPDTGLDDLNRKGAHVGRVSF